MASVLVCFYAWNRFNTPITVRSNTSRIQYWSSCLTYVASSEGLLLLMAWALQQDKGILGVLHAGGDGQLPGDINVSEAPLVAALMLTTLLPSFPLLRDMDARMLKFFHQMGEIPFNAMRWSQRLQELPFTVSSSALTNAKNYLHDNPNLPDTLLDEFVPDSNSDQMRWDFTRVVVLYVAIVNMASYPRFSNAFKEDTTAFEDKIKAFFASSSGYFATASQLSLQGLKPTSDTRESFKKVANETYAEVRLMLARTLLYRCNGEADMTKRVGDLGFAIAPSKPIRLPLNLLSLDLLAVLALFMVVASLAHTMPLGKAMVIGLSVAVNHVIAAGCAILPKQLWSAADIRVTRERPALAYIISCVCAFTVSLPVSYCFYLFRTHFPLDSGPIFPFAAQCKWLLMPAVLALALAFECDDCLPEKSAPIWLRWVEGACLAALMSVMGFLVLQWLEPDRQMLHPNAPLPKLWLPVVLSAAIGALFGSTIPHWYRSGLSRAEGSSPTPPPTTSQLLTPTAETLI
jgi:hypothetical protein